MYCFGTCVNSFDEDGNGIHDHFFVDASEFECCLEEARQLTKEEFMRRATDSSISSLKLNELGLNLTYIYESMYDIYMIYDEDSDIHYFFRA